MADMHFKCTATQGNRLVAQRMYKERFPDGNQPDRRTSEGLHLELCTNGSFYASKRGTDIGRPSYNTCKERKNTKDVKDSPLTSSRTVRHTLGLSHQSALRGLT